uniref:PHD-type domain-containing protein n=1 Tax=Anopheles minimus TaxID=112268 RepID=A0A182W2X4_9DIPT
MPKPKFDCVGCTRENTVADMVRCDQCFKWWHFDCAGVSHEVKNVKWVCELCASSKRDETAEVKSHDPSGKPSRAPRGKTGSQDGDFPKPSGKIMRTPPRSALAISTLPSIKKHAVVGQGIEEAKKSVTCERHVKENMPKSLANEPNGAIASKVDKRVSGQSVRCDSEFAFSARESSSSVSTTSKLKHLARVQELEVAALQAELDAKIAKLRVGYETARRQIEDDSASRKNGSIVSGTSKVLDWLSNHQEEDKIRTVESSVASKCVLEKTPSEGVRPSAVERASARKIWRRKLPPFSGSVKQWPIFYSYYNESTKACGYTSVENIMRLEEALTGPAREAVESKFTLPNAAPMVMDILKKLFGRPGLLVKELIEQARRAEAPKPERIDHLITFGLTVRKLCDHLTACDMTDHLSNPVLLDELVEKLPVNRGLEWVDFKRRFTKPTLKEFGEFMEELIDKCCELKASAKVEDLPAIPYRDAVPRMLIGLRDIALLKPLEVRSSDDGGPIAVRSLLGQRLQRECSIYLEAICSKGTRTTS